MVSEQKNLNHFSFYKQCLLDRSMIDLSYLLCILIHIILHDTQNFRRKNKLPLE